MSLFGGQVYSTCTGFSGRSSRLYPKPRKVILEEALVRRREVERIRSDYWNETNKYFLEFQRKNDKYTTWNSEESYKASMEAYERSKKMELRKQNILVRRTKLKKLLENEQAAYKKELNELPLGSEAARMAQKSLAELRNEKEIFRKKKEEENKRESEEKMLQHWKLNNPEFRQLEVRRHMDLVTKAWDEQSKERKEREEELKREEEAKIRSEVESLQKREDEIRQRELEREKRIREWKEDICKQTAELNAKSRDAELVKAQIREEQEKQKEVEYIEQKLRKMEEKRKKEELGKFLKRQHRLKLRTRALQIQKELEEDRRLLEELRQLEEAETVAGDQERQRRIQDLLWMQETLEKQKIEERKRRKEMDLLFEEEAAKMWDKQESLWQKEKEARKGLMEDVIKGLSEQIISKIEAAQREEEKILEEKKEIMKDIEVMNRSIEDEEQRKSEKRLEFVEGLNGQVLEKQKQKEEEEKEEERGVESGGGIVVRETNQLADKLAKWNIQETGPEFGDFRRRRAKW